MERMAYLLFLAALALGGPAPAQADQPPRLRNPAGMIGRDDYPKDSLKREEFGVVSVALEVSPQGRVTACAVTESSGFVALDTATCALLQSRARFEAAKDAAGQPVAGRFALSTSWGMGEHMASSNMRLTLQAAKLPDDYRQSVRAQVAFDETGHIHACDILQSSGSAAVDRDACAFMTRKLTVPPPKSLAPGVRPEAIRYVLAQVMTRAEAEKVAAQ
ncbi:TonB family protein [Novosphingobium sp. NBM11]|nr:TonB family protein [Novosphingobium sp. NBM11]